MKGGCLLALALAGVINSVAAQPQDVDLTSITKFKEWMDNPKPAGAAAIGPDGKPIDTMEPVKKLAKERKKAMAKLIQKDPKEAIKHAVRPFEKAGLPAEVQDDVEDWLMQDCDVRVAAAFAHPRDAADNGLVKKVSGGDVDRVLDVYCNDKRYSAFVSPDNMPAESFHTTVHGINLNDDDEDVPLLAVNHVLHHRLDDREINARRDIDSSKGPVVAAFATSRGEDIRYFDTEEELAAAANDHTHHTVSRRQSPVRGFPKTGEITILVIPVDFSDDPGDPVLGASKPRTQGAAINQAAYRRWFDQDAKYFRDYSYGEFRPRYIFAPNVIRMPRPKSYYSTVNTFSDLFYGWKSLYPNAPSATTTLVVTAQLGNMAPGYGYINAPGIIVAYDFTPRVSVHELGHNMGADHANLWRASTTTGPGTIQEYYDELGVMGIGSSDGLRHFSAFQKWAWYWMPDKNVAMVEKMGSGKYKLYAQDDRNAIKGNNYLLAMVPVRSSLHQYDDLYMSIEYRHLPIFPEYNSNRGVFIHLVPARNPNRAGTSKLSICSGQNGYIRQGTGGCAASNMNGLFLDLSPGSSLLSRDGVLTKDRVFSDPDFKIHVTLDEVDPAKGYAIVNLIVGTNNCFGHGNFRNGRCECDSGYGGTDCAKQGSGTKVFGDNGNGGGSNRNGQHDTDDVDDNADVSDDKQLEPVKVCRYSDWRNVQGTTCDCRTNTRPQRRFVVEGQGCPGKLTRQATCIPSNCDDNEVNGPKRDCKWSAWSEWSKECLCPSNLQRRTRTRTPAKNGGKPCRGVSFENRVSKNCNCNKGNDSNARTPSTKPDCVWSGWSAWTQCHCDKGYAKRTRTRKTVKKGTGKICRGPAELRKRCSCSRDSAFGQAADDVTPQDRDMINAFPSVGKCDSATNGGCDHTCDITSVGLERCSCNPGYVLAEDGKSCNEQVRVSIVNAEDGGTFAARLADELGVGPGEVKLLFAEVFDTTPEARGAGVTQVGATLVLELDSEASEALGVEPMRALYDKLGVVKMVREDKTPVDAESAAVEEEKPEPANEETKKTTHFNTGAVAGASAGAAGLLLVAVGAGMAVRYRKRRAQEERNRLLKADTVLDIGNDLVVGPTVRV